MSVGAMDSLVVRVLLVLCLSAGLASARAKPPSQHTGILLSPQKYNEAVHGSSKNVFLSKSNASSSDAEMDLYVYLPEENRVVVIKVGHAMEPVATPAAEAASLFMKLTPNLKNLLNPVEVTKFLTSLSGLNVLSPDSLAAYSDVGSSNDFRKPLGQLSLLVNALNDISPSNPQVLTNMLTMISRPDAANPLADLTSFFKVIGVVNPLNPELLVKIFQILSPTVAPLKELWALIKNETLNELERPIFTRPDVVDNETSSEDIRPYPTITVLFPSQYATTVVTTAPLDEPVVPVASSSSSPHVDEQPLVTSEPVELQSSIVSAAEVEQTATEAVSSATTAAELVLQPSSTSEFVESTPTVDSAVSETSTTPSTDATTSAELVLQPSLTSESVESTPTVDSAVSETSTTPSTDATTHRTTIPVTIDYQSSFSTEIAASLPSVLPSEASEMTEIASPADQESSEAPPASPMVSEDNFIPTSAPDASPA